MTIQANFPAIKPSLLLDFANTKQLDSRITYTRASTATFYNGVTTSKAEENLLTYSQEFDNGVWVKSNSTVTANSTTAPDGTSTADTLIEDTNNTSHVVYRTSTTQGTYTFSFYAKANGRTALYSKSATGSSQYYAVLFDLTGVTSAVTVVGTSYTSVTSSIVSVGSGWYRCSYTFTVASSVSGEILIGTSNTISPSYNAFGNITYTGDGTSGLYLWGAQLEQRSAVTAYTATTTQAITNYIPALQSAASGVARFDNNPTTGESLGLLIEESRSNLLTYSSQFDNAAWSKSNATVTADTIVSPDGTLNGDKLVENTSAASHEASQGVAGLAAAVHTFSIYAKAAGRSVIQITFSGNGGSAFGNYDLANGVLGTVGNSGVATITAVGNGWYRCTLASGSAFTAGSCSFVVMPQSSTTASRFASYTGDGFSGVSIWGAQVEAEAFATSYIPTVASQVTRAADAASMTGTNFSTWYNQAQGSIYAEATTPTNDAYRAIAWITDGSSANSIRVGQTTGGFADFTVLSSNATQASFQTTGISASTTKIIAAYKVDDFARVVNGASASTDTSGIVPSVSQLQIGSGQSGSNPLCGTIRKIAYYPLRVTNAQLQALTS
jgi:hypothetical protein